MHKPRTLSFFAERCRQTPMQPEQNERLHTARAGHGHGNDIPALLAACPRPKSCQRPVGPSSGRGLVAEGLVAFRDRAVPSIWSTRPLALPPGFFGRHKECGARYVYQAWKFDSEGRWTDLPSRQAGSRLGGPAPILAHRPMLRGETL